ncbi:unnamed protein product [Brassica oleracea]
MSFQDVSYSCCLEDGWKVLRNAKEHPAAAAGIGLTAGLRVKVPYEEEEDDGGDDDKEKEIVW